MLEGKITETPTTREEAEAGPELLAGMPPPVAVLGEVVTQMDLLAYPPLMAAVAAVARV